MFQMKKMLTLTVMIGLLLSSSASALVGAGFHWGFDFTTTMNDVKDENMFTVKDLGIDSLSGVVIPDELLNTSFMSVSRSGFDRTPINFGGKIFVDVLPVEIEISVNMGVWEYDASVKYMSGVDTVNGNVEPKYEELSLNLDAAGLNYFGVDKTPYGKFHTDITLKKTFKKIPIIKPSFGAGMSVHFATPVVSADLLKSAFNITDNIGNINPDDLKDPAKIKDLLDEILDGAKKPKTGMHFLLGLKLKVPVIPLAVYADGKYMILFDDIEDGVGVNTKGFLVNVGLLFDL